VRLGWSIGGDSQTALRISATLSQNVFKNVAFDVELCLFLRNIADSASYENIYHEVSVNISLGK
jgi:hypothetical protein